MKAAEDGASEASTGGAGRRVGSFSMTCLTTVTFQIDPPPNNPIPLA
jgi:hypothetical protein